MRLCFRQLVSRKTTITRKQLSGFSETSSVQGEVSLLFCSYCRYWFLWYICIGVCSGMVMSPVLQVWPNHLAKHSERGKKTKQTEEEVGRQHQGMDRPGVRQVPEGVENREKWRKLVAKSSVVPQRPSQLRDLWWWWYISVAESMPHYSAHWWIGHGVVSVFSIHHSDWKHPALISPLVTRWRCCFSVQYRCIIMATSIPHYYAHWWIGQGVVSVFSIHHCDWQHLSVLCPLMNRSRCCFGVQHRYIFIMATSISHCSAHWWLGQCVVSVFSIHYSGRKHTSLLCLLVTRSV